MNAPELHQLEIFFHNTIQASPAEMEIYNDKASSLESRILSLFKYHQRPMAWCEVKVLLPPNTNEVSIKRAISNLANPKHFKNLMPALKKTKDMIQGIYKVPVHKYELNKDGE